MPQDTTIPIVQHYLAILDEQREQTFSVLREMPEERLWQRPEPKEWCIGEIINHNVALFQSVFPLVRLSWRFFRWTGHLLRTRAYKTEIEDPYRKDKFPHWAGFLWKPKYTPTNPVSLERLYDEACQVHRIVRDFYEGKDESMLGNVFVFDPLFGFLNLILVLRLGVYHDQLHYEDVIELVYR